MGVFSSKPKVNMESFCKDYYDSQMFHTIVDGVDASQKILDVAFQQLADSDPSFSNVDRTLFDCEMAAMHLELFALAFLNRFPKSDYAVQHSIFTLRYLQNMGRNDIWEAMGEYSKVIAQTATMNANGQPMTGESRIERMKITQINSFRFGLFKDWVKAYSIDSENLTADEQKIAGCIARVCNHVGADILRNNQIGNRRIASMFLCRLGTEEICGKNWQPSDDYLLCVASQPLSMYEFSSKILKTVDLEFSQSK